MSSPNATIALSNGIEMPVIGLGTWQSSPAEVTAAVKAAVKAGYRLIDTASVYQNEEAIGTAIKELIDEGVVKREELFITTKAWTHELAPGRLEGSLRDALKKLKLDYVDLYLAHMPAAFNDDMSEHIASPVEDVWRQFDAVYKAGLAKAVGVSNWNNEQIGRALAVGVTPVHNSQVELHLYFPQHDHVDFCKAHNIVVTSYATLGSPGRVHFTLPTGQKLDWAPAPSELEDANVLALAEKYNKTPAQVLLRYALDRGLAIIPKSINANRIEENFKVFDFSLSTEEIAKLEEKKISQRLFLQDFMAGHPEDAFANERQ
uniref:Aldo_ket_red domain-containing protein n=1 Tax=Caenorhabditis tropicalis TaxID=1561998 RepID=A0A1I7TWH9_9PELO